MPEAEKKDGARVGGELPGPGSESAPQGTSEGMDEAARSDGTTVVHHEQSTVGPGTGENEVVKVTSPVQDEDDEVTSHPTLRDDSRSEER